MPNKHKFGLNNATIKSLGMIFDRHTQIERVLIYGSRALGKQREGSDIDLVMIGPKLSYDDLLTVANEIDDLLLPYKIDLSIWHHIDNDQLTKHIEDHGVVFFERSVAAS